MVVKWSELTRKCSKNVLALYKSQLRSKKNNEERATCLPNAEEETCASKEPETSKETNYSQTGGRPKEGLEEMGRTVGGG